MSPKIVALSLCGSCNLRCWFCRVGTSLRHVHRKPMHPDLVKEILPLFPSAQRYRLGAQCEPTLNTYVEEIVQLLVDAEKNVSLITNGTRLVNLDLPWDQLNSVNVSLNECNARDYFITAGKDFFRKAVSGIEKVVAADARVSVSFVMHRGNFEKVVDYVEFAKQLGASKANLFLYVEPFTQQTDAAQTIEEFAQLQRAAVRELLQHQAAVDELGIKVAWPKVADPSRPLSGGCTQAQRRLDIDGAGDVALCCSGRGPRPEMGNVLEAGPTVYDTGPMAELRARVLGPPDDRPEKCKICRHNYEEFVDDGILRIGSKAR